MLFEYIAHGGAGREQPLAVLLMAFAFPEQ
jgi:hypothetical protein